MKFSTAAASIVLAISLSDAAAVPASVSKQGVAVTSKTDVSFKVPRYRNQNAPARNGPRALQKAFRKYGWEFPALPQEISLGPLSITFGSEPDSSSTSGSSTGSSTGASSASSSSTGSYPNNNGSNDQSGQVNAKPEQYDAEYICPVTIGGQTLNMDFDTGSSDLWVFSTLLSSAEANHHTLFNPQQSKTWQNMKGYSWMIGYGDGSGASGLVGKDTVSIGGVSVENQAVEVANQVSTEFSQDTSSDGLVGLAFSVLNDVQPQQQKTFFDNAIPSLAEPVFSVNLESDGSGYYLFGAYDESQNSKDELASVPVNPQSGFWQFQSTTFWVDDKQYASTNSSPAIADTGTSLIIVDPAVAQQYWSAVPSASNSQADAGYIFPCNASSTLPSFSMALGNSYTAYIPPSLLTYAPVDNNGNCFGAIQSNNGQNMQIYGDVFFRSAYVVFEDSPQFTGLHVASKNIQGNNSNTSNN